VKNRQTVRSSWTRNETLHGDGHLNRALTWAPSRSLHAAFPRKATLADHGESRKIKISDFFLIFLWRFSSRIPHWDDPAAASVAVPSKGRNPRAGRRSGAYARDVRCAMSDRV
jgi:hypothetical protein